MGTAHLIGFIAPHFLSVFYIFPFDEAFHFSVLHLFCGNPEGLRYCSATGPPKRPSLHRGQLTGKTSRLQPSLQEKQTFSCLSSLNKYFICKTFNKDGTTQPSYSASSGSAPYQLGPWVPLKNRREFSLYMPSLRNAYSAFAFIRIVLILSSALPRTVSACPF